MVNIIKRMRKLRELLWIRNGPGAIQLPKEVTKISVEFHKKLIGSQHRGARHFWHDILPRIKYRNPALPISVTRHADPAGPAYLHIFTAQPTPQTAAIPPSSTPQPTSSTPEATANDTPTHTIEIKDFHESEILEALVEKTGAVVLTTPPEEATEMAEIEEFKERAEVDRVEVREKLMKVRREEELLKLARGEISAAS
ncbi:hypothetical protein P171DRAFT_519109 [Karstenula rhodostoma CBS 690.94]|uniref:Ribosomal protein/NADH dehydrogenase domain-containing protein n=1 Tax=Karstenula rhodostoma CBS 690.94 TaxID=1392251 RepID=A0A9P4PKG7_9PLEO|nr:hypothetical protein P171DRAFT_519109 [Karstenula rhodostoma CBS 690.94]